MTTTDIATRRAVLAAAATLALPSVVQAQQPMQLTIGGGIQGDTYQILAGGISTILGRDVPGLTTKLSSTDGSVSNVKMLAIDRSSLGFCQADTAVTAYEGSERFRGRPVPVRAIAVVYTNRMQVVTRASAKIRTFDDLRGKRVSTGSPGSATETMAFRLLVAAGIDRQADLAVRDRFNLFDSSELLASNELDAYFVAAGVPNPIIREQAATPGMDLLLINHANLAVKVIARYGSVYFADTIPAGTYPGQKTDNTQVSVANLLLVHQAMPATQVSSLLTALWAGRDELAQVHPEARQFTVAGQKSAAAGIPWHPGAEAFWKKQGADI